MKMDEIGPYSSNRIEIRFTTGQSKTCRVKYSSDGEAVWLVRSKTLCVTVTAPVVPLDFHRGMVWWNGNSLGKWLLLLQPVMLNSNDPGTTCVESREICHEQTAQFFSKLPQHPPQIARFGFTGTLYFMVRPKQTSNMWHQAKFLFLTL